MTANREKIISLAKETGIFSVYTNGDCEFDELAALYHAVRNEALEYSIKSSGQVLSDDEIDSIHPMDKSFQVWRKSFARAIESAVLAKLNSAEPVCWITPDGEGWRMRYEPPVIDTKLGWSPLYERPPAPVAAAK